MKSGILPFFATPNDLKQLLGKISEKRPIRLVRGGLIDHPDKNKKLATDDLIPRCNYLLINVDETVQDEAIPQRRGGVKYALDLSLNPKAVSLFSGELISPNILLPGQFSTMKGSPEAIELFNLVVKTTKQAFTKIKSCYLGAEALRMLDEGGRLAVSEKGDPLYDLKR